jgi:Ser/Thr protein kinase RdoA (MazF antagonist)
MGYDMGEAQTRAVLREACTATGLSAEGARLLRLGSNAVYRLTAPVVVRIARRDASVARAGQTVAVARWLESAGYPAVRALPFEQPVVIGGHAVTFWEALSEDGDEYATIAEVAEVIARLHALTTPESLHLPPLDPFAKADQRIADSQWLDPGGREFLTGELARLRSEYSKLEFALPQGVIHGDANIGNVLHDSRGNPVVIDLDDFATGPREWDLIQTAIYYDHFGWHSRQEYETFTRAYGYDIMQWPGYPVLSEVREFILVTWIIQKAAENERTAAEAAKRLNALRTGASKKDWLPF